MLHTLTDTQTDGQTDVLNNITLYAPRHEEAFLPIGKKRPHYEEASSPQRQKTASVASLPRPCLVVIGISSLIELKNLFSTPAAPGRYPIPRDRATTHTAAPAISGDRTGVTAKLGERRFFKVVVDG